MIRPTDHARRLGAIALALATVLAAPAAHAAPPQAAAIAVPIRMAHISVEVRGERGTPVILIPGLASPRAAWDGVAPTLARDHRVFLVQVNGFGGDDPGGNLGGAVLDGIVADVAALIRSRKLDRVALVGHSMGGLVGLMLAARHPGAIERLMMVDALPYFAVTMVPPGTPVTPAMVAPQAAAMRDAVAAGYGKPADPAAAAANVAGMTLDPAHRARLQQWAMAADPRVMGQALYEDITTDLRPELGAIKVSVTVAYAWNEAYPRRKPADRFFRDNYAGLAGATFEPIGPARHFVMLDRPAAFQAALDRFLSAK